MQAEWCGGIRLKFLMKLLMWGGIMPFILFF